MYSDHMGWVLPYGLARQTSSGTSSRVSSGAQTCPRTPRRSFVLAAEQPSGFEPSWKPQGAPGVQGSSEQEIEYTIHQDGRVEVRVNGVKGSGCLELTKELEEMLGEVVVRKNTDEMFEQNIQTDNTVINTNQDSSSW